MDDRLWRCVWDADRPHVHPLRTPSGLVLTNDRPDDHPWHRGLWSTVKFVDGVNFWEEPGDHGVLVAIAVERSESQESATIEWRRPDGDVALTETRTIAQSAMGDGWYALDWTFCLSAQRPTVLDRTPFQGWGGYSGLTLRGAPDWVDTVLLTSDGGRHRRLLGVPAPWLAIEGSVDGRPAGVILVDDAANAGHPVPWYASTKAAMYGDGWANFVNAAFLWDGPVTLDPGADLVRRHGVIVHDGAWERDRCAEHASRWSAR